MMDRRFFYMGHRRASRLGLARYTPTRARPAAVVRLSVKARLEGLAERTSRSNVMMISHTSKAAALTRFEYIAGYARDCVRLTRSKPDRLQITQRVDNSLYLGLHYGDPKRQRAKSPGARRDESRQTIL